jgi:hypothetical protein
MAHTAEDIVGKILKDRHNYQSKQLHSDVRHGFIIGFNEKPDIDLLSLEKEALEIISKDIPVSPGKGDYVMFGDDPFYCTGKRIHVKSTGQIEKFRLLKEYKYDPISDKHLLVGVVGEESIEIFHEHAPIQVEATALDKALDGFGKHEHA